MRKAAFTTLGCKVNQYETQKILEDFERAGFDIVPFDAEADVYVINTCSVTGQAESKSRQTVRRAARQNPEAKVIVTGCAGQMALNHGREFEEADLVVPNPKKLETLKRFLKAYPGFATGLVPRSEVSAPGFSGRTRATVKIQDGCSVHCSYCSIPKTRPVMTSRDFEEVIEECRAYARRGFREIVLTGVLIGAYGPETGSGGPDFEELLELLCAQDCIDQLRISSIEMRQVSPRLIELMSRDGSKIAPHLHIPLQSGSTKVLSDMNRPYTQEDYIRLCDEVQRRVMDVAITTDIMVGFPTETLEEFEETVKVCEAVRFARAHIFRFSERPGTRAEVLGDPVAPAEKQARSIRLMEVTERTRREFVRRHLGRTLPVLVETKDRSTGLLKGHTPNYIEALFPGPEAMIGKFVEVRLDEERSWVALGESVANLCIAEDRTELRVVN